MSINLIIFVIMIGRVEKSRNHEEEYGSLSHAFSPSFVKSAYIRSSSRY